MSVVDRTTVRTRPQGSTSIPVDRAHRLAERIPGAELRLVPEAGRLIQLDTPEQLTAILHSWLLEEAGGLPSHARDRYRPAAVPGPGGAGADDDRR